MEIEATYCDIQIKLQHLRQVLYVPPKGQRLIIIDQAWVQLVKQDYLAEVALKEEAISADIFAMYERFRDLKAMSSQLQQERYWRRMEMDREKAIMQRWDSLQQLLRLSKRQIGTILSSPCTGGPCPLPSRSCSRSWTHLT